MQSQEDTRLDETSPEEGAIGGAAPAVEETVSAGPVNGRKKASKKKAGKKKATKKKSSKKKAGKKKTSKKKSAKKKASKKKTSKKKTAKKKTGKKTSKKKASKKKTAKKKASKKKASKKKASKKKRGKKKRAAAGSDHMSRLIAAVEELRAAVVELASTELSHRRQAVEDLRETARAKISDLETAAQNSLARLTGKG